MTKEKITSSHAVVHAASLSHHTRCPLDSDVGSLLFLVWLRFALHALSLRRNLRRADYISTPLSRSRVHKWYQTWVGSGPGPAREVLFRSADHDLSSPTTNTELPIPGNLSYTAGRHILRRFEVYCTRDGGSPGS